MPVRIASPGGLRTRTAQLTTVPLGENNLSFIETSALDASNVELAFQNILTGTFQLTILSDIVTAMDKRLTGPQRSTASCPARLLTKVKAVRTCSVAPARRSTSNHLQTRKRRRAAAARAFPGQVCAAHKNLALRGVEVSRCRQWISSTLAAMLTCHTNNLGKVCWRLCGSLGNAFTDVCSYFHDKSASMCKCCVGSGLPFLSFPLRCMLVGPLFYLGGSKAGSCCMVK